MKNSRNGIGRMAAALISAALVCAAFALPSGAQTKSKNKGPATGATPAPTPTPPAAAQPAVAPEEQREAYLWSGIAKRQQGKFREAIDDLTIYVSGSDRDPDGHWELGYAWALYNDARPSPASRRKAADAFKRCYERSPGYQRVIPPSVKASVVETMKEGKKEAGVVSEAEPHRPADPEGLLQLAETQADSGDVFEARRNYDEVRYLPPPPPAADRERVRLKLDKGLREKLTKIVWPDSFVADAALSQNVWLVRKALGRRPDGKDWLETAPRRGYRFTGTVTRVEPGPAAFEGVVPICRLVLGRRRIPLEEGETIIGRNPDFGVCLDSPTVSRRHARVVVTDGTATIEDLGSKNGTYRRKTRIEGVVHLADGDSLRVGSVELVFRTTSGIPSTQTEVSRRRSG